MSDIVNERQLQIDEINKYFPDILGKIEKNETLQTRTYTLATIVRVMGKDMLWYDVPHIYHHTSTEEGIKDITEDILLFKLYQVFNKEVYIKKHFNIPTKETAVISKYQISERDRLQKVYNL